MARYTQDSRERVRDAVDFVELVGARTELRAAGVRRLQGLCPFHDERTPSFGIDPVEKLYHCFGCGVGGDVFSFVMETEGLDFAGALEALADRYGVKLEREAEDPRDAARRERRDRLLALLERTAAYYVRVLWESPGGGARARVPGVARARGGRAARVPGRASRRARTSGWWARRGRPATPRRSWWRAGSRRRAGTAAALIDRFRGRIMFPLCDERGRVLGFGARALRAGRPPEVPQLVRQRGVPQGRAALRRRPRPRGRGARRAAWCWSRATRTRSRCARRACRRWSARWARR